MPRGTSIYDEARLQGRLWTPLNLGSALIAWWDPSQGVVQNATGVVSWADRVGGVVASYITANSQPSWSPTARNGRPGIVMTTNSQSLSFTPGSNWPVGAVPLSVAAVGYCSSGVGTGDYRGIFGYGESGSGLEVYDGASYLRVSSAGNGDLVSTTKKWYGVDQIFIATSTGSTAIIYAAGVSAASGSVPITPDLTGGAIGTGIQYNGDYWNGVIQDILLISGVLTLSQRRKMNGFLAWKNNLLKLPAASDPFKNRPPLIGD